MNKYQLLKLFLSLKKSQEKGITLTELLVAIVISSIVLTAAASGLINVLSANQNVESKTVRSSSLNKAVAYIQDDIKAAKSVTQEPQNTNCSSSAISSANCLVLTYPASYNTSLDSACTSNTIVPKVYYGYQDITNGTQQWLKPGILKRKIVCSNSSGSAVTTLDWEVIADGLISVREANPAPACNSELATWTGSSTVYGANSSGKGGFRFCLNDTTATNRLARVFLYGNIVGGNANRVIPVNTVTFARSE
jgi:prepilin-type N-terminal cleavage/methylation domain-containing protein